MPVSKGVQRRLLWDNWFGEGKEIMELGKPRHRPSNGAKEVCKNDWDGTKLVGKKDKMLKNRGKDSPKIILTNASRRGATKGTAYWKETQAIRNHPKVRIGLEESDMQKTCGLCNKGGNLLGGKACGLTIKENEGGDKGQKRLLVEGGCGWSVQKREKVGETDEPVTGGKIIASRTWGGQGSGKGKKIRSVTTGNTSPGWLGERR